MEKLGQKPTSGFARQLKEARVASEPRETGVPNMDYDRADCYGVTDAKDDDPSSDSVSGLLWMAGTDIVRALRSKMVHTTAIAARMREFMGATWCLAESGATGPTFLPADCSSGFTAIAIAGPDPEQDHVALVVSDHGEREKNMWQFTASSLALMAEALERHASP